MDLRFTIALIVGKLTAFLLILKGSGATAAPGLYALNIDPDFVKKFSQRVHFGSIIVSGTNGKTTTSRLIYNLLSEKYKIIHNRQGSNLLRGLASTFINNSSILGKLDANIALWEVDEAVLPEIVTSTNPKTVVLLNLFRDQLDRYGEVDSIRKSWQKWLIKIPRSTNIILNEDDPGIKSLEKYAKGKSITFGIQDKEIKLPKTINVSDIKRCPNCGSNLEFSAVFSAHIGHYYCNYCSFRRKIPNVSASGLVFKRGFKTSLTININKKKSKLNLNLPGLYNVYNLLAASTVFLTEKIDSSKLIRSLQKFSSAFGRYQSFEINGKKIIIFLIKNPAGANEVLRTISLEDNLNILAILNDKIADGTDVSWIWDTNWEIIASKIKSVSVSGTRSWDLANRLKYAGVNLSNKNVYKQNNYPIGQIIKNMETKDTLLILPTYTALLETQKNLSKLSSQEKWHKN